MSMRQFWSDEKNKIRRMSAQRRTRYIWDYYRLPIIAVLVVVVIVSVSVVSLVRHKDKVLYVALVNAIQSDSSLFADWLSAVGYDPQRLAVEAATDFTLHLDEPSEQDAYTLQALAALFGIGDLDLFAADQAAFNYFAETGGFEDLLTRLPASFISEHKENIYYVTDEASGEQYAAGIYPQKGSPFDLSGYFPEPVAIGIVANAQNMDNAVMCIQWLVTGPSDVP